MCVCSGPRCVALFDYEGEEDDELTFSQGDVIALIELIGQEWGRGQIHGRIGIFPLSFAEVVEPLPQPTTLPGVTTKTTSTNTAVIESTGEQKNTLSFFLSPVLTNLFTFPRILVYFYLMDMVILKSRFFSFSLCNQGV